MSAILTQGKGILKHTKEGNVPDTVTASEMGVGVFVENEHPPVKLLSEAELIEQLGEGAMDIRPTYVLRGGWVVP